MPRSVKKNAAEPTTLQSRTRTRTTTRTTGCHAPPSSCLDRPELGGEMPQKRGCFHDLKAAKLFFPRINLQDRLNQLVAVNLGIDPARNGQAYELLFSSAPEHH